MLTPTLPTPLLFYIRLRIRTYVDRKQKVAYTSGQISVNFNPCFSISMRALDARAMQVELLQLLSTKYPDLEYITTIFGSDLLQLGTWLEVDIRASAKYLCKYFGDVNET